MPLLFSDVMRNASYMHHASYVCLVVIYFTSSHMHTSSHSITRSFPNTISSQILTKRLQTALTIRVQRPDAGGRPPRFGRRRGDARIELCLPLIGGRLRGATPHGVGRSAAGVALNPVRCNELFGRRLSPPGRTPPRMIPPAELVIRRISYFTFCRISLHTRRPRHRLI